MNDIDIIGQIADLKENQHHLALRLTSLIEILMTKNILTKDELALKAEILDLASEAVIQSKVLLFRQIRQKKDIPVNKNPPA